MTTTKKDRGGSDQGVPRIGLIEETSDNIYSIKFVLQSIGYEVASFSFRDPYLEPLHKFNPNLLIVDMMIPEGGAYGVMQELKEGELKKVPILAVTADAMQGEEKDVYRAGAQDIIAKPYPVDTLQAKLQALLG